MPRTTWPAYHAPRRHLPASRTGSRLNLEDHVDRHPDDALRSSRRPGSAGTPGEKVPALSRGVAVALHLWIGLMALGWLYMDYLVARSDGDDVGGFAMLLGTLVITWPIATVLLLRLHARSSRLAWLPILGWLAIAAVSNLAV